MNSLLTKLIDHYTTVIGLIQKAGFEKAIIFKGFTPEDTTYLNFVVTDSDSEKEETRSQVSRLADLKNQLIKLLEGKVTVVERQAMDVYFLNKLDATNSVQLALNLEDITAVNFTVNALKKTFSTNASLGKFLKESSEFSKPSFEEVNKLNLSQLVEINMGMILKELAQEIKNLSISISANPQQLLDAVIKNLNEKLMSQNNSSLSMRLVEK